MKVLAIIPARSGSKSVPHKNVRLLQGKPLLAHSIGHALAAKRVTRTIVSTDSEDYAAIAREYGAEAPFLRPPEFSGDMATDWEIFYHALNWLRENERWSPDICVHLRPTHPIRNPQDIDHMVKLLINNPEWDSVRSVVTAPETPYKMWFRDAEGMLAPVIQTEIREAYNQPRQSLPPTYLQNASIDVVRSRVILEQRSMTGRNIHGYIMEESFDIDTEGQLEIARQHLEANHAPLASVEPPPARTFVFDIDGVIANLVPSLDYALATPNEEVIRMVNYLHGLGHRVILFTARGSQTGKDWTETTRRQMSEWGVKYQELRFGKPAADYYVDDRLLSIEAVTALAQQWGLDLVE